MASAFLALLLTLPLTGWLLLPALNAAGHGAAPSAADACAHLCAMHGMNGMAGMACPMMAQQRRDQICSCQISGTPRTLALGPVHAIAPKPADDAISFRVVSSRVFLAPAASSIAGFPGAIDHPPSLSC